MKRGLCGLARKGDLERVGGGLARLSSLNGLNHQEENDDDVKCETRRNPVDDHRQKKTEQYSTIFELVYDHS